MKDSVVKFDKVYKRYKKGRKLLLKEALLDIFKPGQTDDFFALRGVSFELKKGETLGIIGTNGSGKSTILKLIAGVTVPTKGKVVTNGRIAPLIELGAGFHPELSGRENIYLNGVILGLNRNYIESRFDEIVEFSELAEFIDTPVKHYSSGMYMRLAFSIAIHTNPDILLVDEILAVGDEAFQEKCMDKMGEFKKQGVSIVFISHDLEGVKKFTDRVLLLDNGKIIDNGAPDKIINKFRKIK